MTNKTRLQSVPDFQTTFSHLLRQGNYHHRRGMALKDNHLPNYSLCAAEQM